VVGIEQVGEWSFIACVLIAIIAGAAGYATYEVSLALIVLGLIVGFLNVAEKEAFNFLIAAIALLLAGTAGLGQLPVIGPYIEPILTNIATFVAPAAIVVGLKALYDLARR